jgi:hypothetical protein
MVAEHPVVIGAGNVATNVCTRALPNNRAQPNPIKQPLRSQVCFRVSLFSKLVGLSCWGLCAHMVHPRISNSCLVTLYSDSTPCRAKMRDSFHSCYVTPWRQRERKLIFILLKSQLCRYSVLTNIHHTRPRVFWSRPRSPMPWTRHGPHSVVDRKQAPGPGFFTAPPCGHFLRPRYYSGTRGRLQTSFGRWW